VRDYLIADVFCQRSLEGNPVAVFTDGSGLSAEAMQATARELNLSETVFLLEPEAEADARARIFTPYTEMPFAGHPVLGTAFVLGERDGGDQIRLETGAGLITINLRREGGRIVYGEMLQPIPTWSAFAGEQVLLSALGVSRAVLPVEVYDNGPRHVYVALETEAAVAGLRPDLNALEQVGDVGVSCFAVNGTQVKTRMFAPALGVAEDPATGSAAGPLAVHLARHGVIPFGTEVEIAQGEEIGRPSQLRAMAEGVGDEITAVRVGGGAVIVARGQYQLD
jgi:trans-2,3-dihydro-3-hydroxyanthranilate isomerase